METGKSANCAYKKEMREKWRRKRRVGGDRNDGKGSDGKGGEGKGREGLCCIKSPGACVLPTLQQRAFSSDKKSDPIIKCQEISETWFLKSYSKRFGV